MTDDVAPLVDGYREFLEQKIIQAPLSGFRVSDEEVNPELKPHCRIIVPWALAGGCRAIFANFGLHKTAMQIELMRLVGAWTGQPTLIVLPLGVRGEFFREAKERFRGDFAVRLKFIRSPEEIEQGTIHLTNYETVRDGKLDPGLFAACSLDEADILRSFGSKTFQTFLPLFDKVPYRFVATATPSPNRFKELIHYAGFLGVMDTGQALTRFFQRDPQEAGNLTLYPHKVREFWLWVSTWAVMIQRPSDLGCSDEGYILPELDVRWHEVPTDHRSAEAESDGQMRLLKEEATGVTAAAREKRDSLPARLAKLLEIRAEDPDAHRIIWHDLEDERRAIEKAAPSAVSVFGTQDLDEREQAIADFSDGHIAELSTKPILAGAGCNFQRHCSWAVFMGIGHKFRDFIQAIHRIQRFGQSGRVRIDIIYTEAERGTRRSLEAKWAQHDETMETVSAIIREYGLNRAQAADVLRRTIGLERQTARGERWWMANNDCVDEVQRMEPDSIDLVVTSIPFANHYEYTPSYNDFGHTDDNDHFWRQMDFLTPGLLRALRPGRLACIHVKDRIVFGSVSGAGAPTVSPFHAEAIQHYRRHGFDYMGMITVVTDVVAENNQTYRLGYTEMCKDSTKMGVGSPEYVLLLRKPQSDRSKSYADDRVTKDPAEYSLARWQVDAHAFWRSSGNRLLTADELAAMPVRDLPKAFAASSLAKTYDFEEHVAIGDALAARGRLPKKFMALAPGSWTDEVWHDVTRMLTLNNLQVSRNREKHVCPLQFDIVDRLIERFSQKGELVFDPFGGIGTVPYRAIGLGRRGAASELHEEYFRDAIRYLEQAEAAVTAPSLFDMLGGAPAEMVA